MENAECCPCVELLTWKNQKKTAIAFVAVNLLFISLCYYSLLSLVSLFLMYFCIAGVGLNFFYKFTSHNKEDEKQEDIDTNYEYVSAEKIHNCIIAFYVTINDGLEHLKNIASLEDSAKFLKILGFLFVLATFSYFLSDFTLIWLGTVLAFVLPKIYSMQKEKIEQIIMQNSESVRDVLNKLFVKIPKYSDLKED